VNLPDRGLFNFGHHVLVLSECPNVRVPFLHILTHSNAAAVTKPTIAVEVGISLPLTRPLLLTRSGLHQNINRPYIGPFIAVSSVRLAFIYAPNKARQSIKQDIQAEAAKRGGSMPHLAPTAVCTGACS